MGSEMCIRDSLMMEHSKRSNEMHEEDALKMKERKRDLWIKMMKILKLESELKSTNIKIDQTKKRLLDYCQKQQQRQQQYDNDNNNMTATAILNRLLTVQSAIAITISNRLLTMV